MDLPQWRTALDAENQGALLLLGVPSLHCRGETFELGPQRAAILAALIFNAESGLSTQALTNWVWGENVEVSRANVTRHMRILRVRLAEYRVSAVIETPQDNPARRYRLRQRCAVDVDAFAIELKQAALAWSASELTSARRHAEAGLTFWREPRAMVSAAGTGPELEQAARVLEADYRRAVWIVARTSFLVEDWKSGAEVLSVARGVDEHRIDVGLAAAHCVGVSRTAGRRPATQIAEQLCREHALSLDAMPRLSAVLDAPTTHRATELLGAYDSDFGLATPTIDLRGAPEHVDAATTTEVEKTADGTGVSLVDGPGPPPVSPKAGSGDVDVEIDLRGESEPSSETPLTADPPGERARDSRSLWMRWLAPLALLGVLVGLFLLVVMSVRGDRDSPPAPPASPESTAGGQTLLDVDFSTEDEVTRWRVTEEVVGDRYLSGITSSGAVVPLPAADTSDAAAEADGESENLAFELVANPDALPARSHHLIAGRWLPGPPVEGRYQLSADFFLPEESALVTQTGPEVSVQITSGGLTVDAAVQAAPSPYVFDLSVWSTGDGWRPIEAGTYRPVVGQWQQLTLTFDTRTKRYESFTIGPVGETAVVYDLSSEVLVAVDKAPDPAAEDFADGVVVTLEVENLWSKEEDLIAASSRVFYDNVQLVLEAE